MLLKISEAVVPEAIKSLPTFTTFLSAFCSIVERSLTTVTPSISFESLSIEMVPTLLEFVLLKSIS